MEEKTINDAKTGDIVTLHGTQWRVIGYTERLSALLERVGCEDTPVNHRTHHSVTLGSKHAEEFKLYNSDLIEARKIVAANCDGEAVEQVLSGYLDTRAVIAALAAIKRGRELERGE